MSGEKASDQQAVDPNQLPLPGLPGIDPRDALKDELRQTLKQLELKQNLENVKGRCRFAGDVMLQLLGTGDPAYVGGNVDWVVDRSFAFAAAYDERIDQELKSLSTEGPVGKVPVPNPGLDPEYVVMNVAAQGKQPGQP